MADIKYKYAYTEEKVLICIDDILPEERKSHKYYCISCGQELLPRALQSKKVTPHFYHKEEVECSGETYLHKLAKKLIKAKFDSRQPFAIKYPVTIECEKDSCNLVTVKCTRHEDYVLNLYDYYDTCTEEVSYGGFVADLLLTNSQKESRQPLFIEIYVKHRCVQKKIDSGLKIVEIYFKSEESILKFIEKEIIDIKELQRDSRLSSYIKLYSFKRTIKKLLSNECEKFYLKDFVSKSTPSSSLNVQSSPVKVGCKDSFFLKQHEVNTHPIDIQQRSCLNCKNNNWFQEGYGMAACKDWQKLKLESLINPNYALECSHFESKHLDNVIPEKAISQPELMKAICPEYAWQSKDSTPASFPCCPTQISDRAIDDYCDKLLIGDVYCEIPLDDGGKLCHKVIDKTCVDDNKAFFVISKNEDAYKKFALHKVYLLDDKFIHENIGQCFDEQEARKNLAKNQGLEWNGTDTIDDFFKF